MTRECNTSAFVARTVARENTGTSKFLASWDRQPDYVRKVLAKGKLHRSLGDETAEEVEDTGVEGDADAEIGGAVEALQASSSNSIDLAVRSWERAHESKEGKLSQSDKAACRELMSGCFERVAVLHERRVKATQAALHEAEATESAAAMPKPCRVSAACGPYAPAAQGSLPRAPARGRADM